MPVQPRHLRVFLASPGDVVAERELALEVLDGLPYEPTLRGRVTVENVAWDKRGAGAPILAGITPQASIAAGLPKPSACDIVVVIFWGRMGTPLPDDYRKSDGTRYESGTEWEYEEAVAGFRTHGKPYVLLYRCTHPHLLDPTDPAVDERLAQWRKVEKFFAGLRNADGSAGGGFTEYKAPADFRQTLETDLKSLIVRILAEEPPAAASNNAPQNVWQGSPFPGLRAFAAADAPIFHGRVREVDEVIARIAQHPFVGVVGASGSGKSSLIAAGVVPRLQLTAGSSSEGRWIPVQFTPDQIGVNDPFASTAAAILSAFPSIRKKQLGTELRDKPELLARLLSDAIASEQGARVLLFVDQFEELFTTVLLPSLRDAFVEMLRIAATVPAIRIIITVRADFYGKCVEHPVLARMLESSTFPLSAPGVGALAEMISKPAARAGLTFEDALPQRILDDTGDEPGALALMAYMLDELYRRSANGLLTHAAYEDLGGVQGAIGKRSESVFLVLGEEEKAELPRVFRELVKVDERGNATRQRARLSRVADNDAALRLTNALTDARLLVQSRGEDNEPVVEVAHEALFRSWSRLAEWINEAQDDLRLHQQVRAAAAEWHASGRRDDYLWSHERLEPVYAMRERLGVTFDAVLADFTRPESARLVDAVKSDQRFFRQRPHIERLIEIGLPAAESIVECLQYARTGSARAELCKGLAALGQVGMAHLLNACRSSDPAQRRSAVEALIAIQTRESVAALPRLINDVDAAVREAAIRAAAHSRDRTLIAPIVLAAGRDADVNVRRTAAVALGAFTAESAFEGMIACLRDESESVVVWTLEMLRILASRTNTYAEHIDHSSFDQDLRTLCQLVEANHGTLQFSPRRDQVAEAVAVLLDTARDEIRTSATKALFALDHPYATELFVTRAANVSGRSVAALFTPVSSTISRESVRAAARLLHVPHQHVRIAAAKALAELADPPSFRARWITPEEFRSELLATIGAADILALAEDHANASLRKSLITVLGVLGVEEGADLYSQLLHDADGEVRRRAAFALGSIGHLAAIPALLARLTDRSSRVAHAVATALTRLRAGEAAYNDASRLFSASIDDPAMDGLTIALVPLLAQSAKGIEVLRASQVSTRRGPLHDAIKLALDPPKPRKSRQR